MKQYLELLKRIRTEGVEKDDRTGTGTLSIFGHQMRFDLADGFPLVTTKKVHLRSIIYELLWFLRGDTNVKWLKNRGVTIWNEWADEEGNLGPVYGKQWRQWAIPTNLSKSELYFHRSQLSLFALEETPEEIYEDEWVPPNNYGKQWRNWKDEHGDTIDQIDEVVKSIKKNPYSRRLIVSAWNPAEISKMRLAPCHAMFQFYVVNGRLSCQLYQRSADVFLGVPFNIASYALLTMMIAQVANLKPGEFIHTFGDAHIYLNHINQVDLQLSREPYPLPEMWINPEREHLDSFQYEDFEIIGYKAHPHIKAPVAV